MQTIFISIWHLNTYLMRPGYGELHAKKPCPFSLSFAKTLDNPWGSNSDLVSPLLAYERTVPARCIIRAVPIQTIGMHKTHTKRTLVTRHWRVRCGIGV